METIKAEIQNVTCAFDPDPILSWEEQEKSCGFLRMDITAALRLSLILSSSQ